jgi:UDP-glucose 4-epimerase
MVIVFGAGGFIGTYLIEQLVEEGFDVLATDISDSGEAYCKERGIPFLRLDITKEKDFDYLPETEAAVNLACLQPANVARHEYNSSDYVRTNTIGTLNVLELCRKKSIPKVIYTCSHRNTQGLWGDRKPIREQDGRAIKFTGEYAMYSISESAATDCVQHYTEAYGIQGIILRLPPVYGYGPHTEIFKHGKPQITGFKIFIENASAGKQLEIWGDAQKGRDIIYVKDVVSAIILALKSNKAKGLYNIASGKLLTLEDEARTIAKVFSAESSVTEVTFRPQKPNSIESFVYDINKAKRDLGWSPRYSFEQMLIDYVKEMKSGRFNFLLEKRRQMLQK